jgi:CheY-like chemotaxis protein
LSCNATHYQVVFSSSAEMALARQAELKTAGADVPLVLADQQKSGMGGTQLLGRVRQILSHGPARAFDLLGRAVDACAGHAHDPGTAAVQLTDKRAQERSSTSTGSCTK